MMTFDEYSEYVHHCIAHGTFFPMSSVCSECKKEKLKEILK